MNRSSFASDGQGSLLCGAVYEVILFDTNTLNCGKLYACALAHEPNQK